MADGLVPICPLRGFIMEDMTVRRYGYPNHISMLAPHFART